MDPLAAALNCAERCHKGFETFMDAHTGKTSVVTGGNSGIGVETVRALASAGSRVILTSRSVEAGEKVAQQLKADGVKVRA